MEEFNNEQIVEDYGTQAQPPKQPIAALILSIASILFCAVPVVGLVLSIVGLVLGIKGKQNGAGGMAIAAIICSIVGILGSISLGSCIGCVCLSCICNPEEFENGFMEGFNAAYYHII